MKASRILVLALSLGLTSFALQANAADDQDTISAAPAPAPAPRAYYDSSTDRAFDSSGQSVGVRSGASSDDSSYVAPRQDATPRSHNMNQPTRIDNTSNTTAPAMGHETDPRAQSPVNGLIVDAGLGAGFGMHAPGAVWGLGSEYRFGFADLPDRLDFKGLFDVNFGYGTDTTQFLSLGVGANWYMGDFLGTEVKRSYLGVDASIGDATNAVTAHSATSVVLGAGFSYTFLHTTQCDFNGMIHYAILLNKLDSSLPSLLTFRVGIAF